MKVLVTGMYGHLAQYIIKYFLDKGYEVIGTYNQTVDKTIYDMSKIKMVYLNCLYDADTYKLIEREKPDYFINCAGYSHSAESGAAAGPCFLLNFSSILNQLEGIRHYSPQTKYINLGSVTENDFFSNPYVASKRLSRDLIKYYRGAGIWAAQPYLGNFESNLRRGFLSDKLVAAAKQIKRDLDDNRTFEPILVGNIYAQKSFLHTSDLPPALDKILQAQTPYDETIATTKLKSAKDLISEIFNQLDIQYKWSGYNDLKEICTSNGKTLVKISKEFYRPSERTDFVKEAAASQKVMGWSPQVTFEDMITKLL